jgi:hypothetical protein
MAGHGHVGTDRSGNGRVDLADVILLVKDFARSADNPSAFSASVENLVTALRVVAGLKTVIKPAKDTQSANTSSFLDLPYLVSSYNVSTAPNIWTEVGEKSFYCQSIELGPISPPPQTA